MRITVLLCFIFVFNGLQAQNDTLLFYPVNNALLQHCYIHNIAIADDGKLWLSTNQGFVSYDGSNVQIFDTYHTFASFVTKKANFYLIEINGIYYFNTRTGNEEYLDINLKPENFSRDPRSYTDIFVDTEESIWCAKKNGFFQYNRITKKTIFFAVYSAFNNHQIAVRNIQGDLKNADILWLATDEGIYKFNKKTHNLLRNFYCSNPQDSSFSDALVSKMLVDSTDTIWFIGGKRGVGCYDTKKGKYTIYPYRRKELNKIPDIDLTFLQVKNVNKYYIGSPENYPGIFNKTTHQYTFNSKPYKKLSASNIDHFMVDSIGNAWCIISGQLYYASAKKNKFTIIPLRDRENKSLVKNIFKTVIWDAEKKSYYAVFDNGDAIFVLDENMNLINSIPIQAAESGMGQSSERHTYDISLDNENRLWVCGTSLKVYDSLAQSLVPAEKIYKNLRFHNQHFQNIIYRNHYLYLQPSNPAYKAIYRISLVSYTYDSIYIPYEIIPPGYENSWNQKEHQEIAIIDKQGNYAYIGTGNYILQLNLLTKKVKKITRVSVRDNGNYLNMSWYTLDDDGNLWVSSSDGIKVINPNTLESEKKINQGYETNRFQIYNADGLGIMCVLYSEGILLYDYRNKKEYHLSLSDGLITLFNSSIACANHTLFVGAEFDALQYMPLNMVINYNTERKCYLSGIQVFNTPYSTDTLPQYIHSLRLTHDKDFISFTISSTEFEQAEQLEYRYKLEGVDKEWVNTNYLNRTISYTNLKPGDYVFYTSIKNRDGIWNYSKVNLHFSITPAWWQTTWFKIFIFLIACIGVYMLIHWRVRSVRRQEHLKSKYEKEMLELEAKALRAQMNPHFIFNCLNSIKALMQEEETEKGVKYLTTFSKLIRTLFNNADKKEISLYDEIETCNFYLQLEAMRFDAAFNYTINTDPEIDLKSVYIPALIIQPFIENAIWHGIVPGGTGGNIRLDIERNNGYVDIIVEDDGIGREVSRQNKSATRATHDSKGVSLTQSRLELDNLLKQRNARFEIFDKKDEMGNALGTKVIIKIQEETE